MWLTVRGHAVRHDRSGNRVHCATVRKQRAVNAGAQLAASFVDLLKVPLPMYGVCLLTLIQLIRQSFIDVPGGLFPRGS